MSNCFFNSTRQFSAVLFSKSHPTAHPHTVRHEAFSHYQSMWWAKKKTKNNQILEKRWKSRSTWQLQYNTDNTFWFLTFLNLCNLYISVIVVNESILKLLGGLFPWVLSLPQAVCSGSSARCEGVPDEGRRSDRGELSACPLWECGR